MYEDWSIRDRFILVLSVYLNFEMDVEIRGMNLTFHLRFQRQIAMSFLFKYYF